MDIYKNILKTVSFVMLSLLTGCGKSEERMYVIQPVAKEEFPFMTAFGNSQFPVDQIGFPQDDIVCINGKYWKMDNAGDGLDKLIDGYIDCTEIAGDEIEIALAQGYCMCTWVLGDLPDGVEWIDYERFGSEDSRVLEYEGDSAVVEIFTFKISDRKYLKRICFKRVDVFVVGELEYDGTLNDNVSFSDVEYMDQIEVRFK